MLVLQSGKGQNGSLLLLASHPKHRYVSTLDASVVTVKYVLPLPPEEFDGTGGVRTDIISAKSESHTDRQTWTSDTSCGAKMGDTSP